MTTEHDRNVRNWPFLWGFIDTTDKYPGSPGFAVHKDKTYVFPDSTTPRELKDDAERAAEIADGASLFPIDLGMCDVIMTGEQFIQELDDRGVDPLDIGEWSKP